MDVRGRVENHLDEILTHLKTLVSYDSTMGASEEGYPFGKVPAACLNKALEIADSYGFKTVNLDNYIGYAEMGEGKDLIGILAHLDVVPAGEGWNTDPFDMVIKDGKAYGRGTTDDKGAVVASMIAMQIVKELNVPLTKRVRLIMGTNEENGSKCLEHYVEKEGHIDMGFTPDGCFPGVHGEKGMVGGQFHSKETKIHDIQGGVASNVVCNKCTITIDKNSFSTKVLEDYFNDNDIEYSFKDENDTITIEAHGVAAHASTPSLGKNAISHLLVGLKKAGYQDAFVDFYNDRIGLTTDGSLMGAKCSDEYGELTFNVGVIGLKEGKISGTIDIRFPVTMTVKQILEKMTPNLETEGGYVEITKTHEPLYFPIDSPLVTKLLEAYQEVTGDMESIPLTMGGGTYAKGINNCIAFGCEMQDVDNHIHDANEFISIEALVVQTEIYVNAIIKLMNN
ncbi:dipeptidase PepV [Anaerorhabdus sp.]|uniref:dipeptidase PepV n=1 Tax=Anaerorhabdus sp. TaxID=1872524 RepID=UPI002FC6BEA1